MILLKTSTRHEARASYDDRHTLKAAGFRWDPAAKVWWCAGVEEVERLRGLGVAVEIHEQSEQAGFDIPDSWEGHPSCATDGPTDIPCPPGLSYLPYQRGGIAYARGKQGVLVGDEMGLGKAQPLDEPVLTPFGFFPIGRLEVGDMVIGSNGRAVAVTGVFPQGVRKIKKVVMSDGSWTRCCGEHLWAYQTANDRGRRSKKWRVSKLDELNLSGSNGFAQVFVPMVGEVEYFSISCPLEPWLVGMLIGDGCLRRNGIAVSNPEPDILKAIDDSLPLGVRMEFIEGCDWRLCGKRGEPNELLDAMRDLGLTWKFSHERRVPRCYLRARPSWRLAVLQGLMDSDGTPGSARGTVEFCTTSPGLVEDVKELVHGLGGTCAVYSRPEPVFSHNGKKKIGRPCWRLNVKLPVGMEPFLHSGQKVARMLAGKQQRPPYRAILSVEDAGEAECVCISVDADDHLYVTRDFIVTHNTIQAIGMMNDEPIKTALIICPSSLKLNWQREIDKWLNYYRPIHVVEKAAHPLPRDVGVLIVNYDIVAKMRDRLGKVAWDVLVCDEAHLLKNLSAKRTQAVLGRDGVGGIEASRRIFLTGTPAESRPSEIFPIANSLRPDVFPSWLDYAFRYCAAYQTKYGLDARGASNVGELQATLRETFMVRRMKKDVLKDLPAKIRVRVTLPCDAKLKKTVEAELAAHQRERELIASLKRKGASHEDVAKARNDASARMRSLRVATSEGKMPMALEFLRNAADAEKVVVFAYHHQVLDALIKEFGDSAVVVTGQVSVEDRQKAVDRFQNDPDCRVFIGQIVAAGVGLTLTASSHVCFVEFDWRPGMLEQCEDRCHRIGQTDSVTCSYLVIENSLDDVQLSSVEKKRNTIAATLNATP